MTEENLTPEFPSEDEPTDTPLPTEADMPEVPETIEASRPEETPPPPVEPEIPPATPANGEKELSETATSVDKAMEESESEKEPSKFQLFMRKLLLWLAVIIGSALAGFLAFYFAFYRPQAAELKDVYIDLDAAQSEVATIEADYAELEAQVADLEEAEFQSILLDITTDIYAARLALADEDTVAAKAALATTESKIESILDELTAFDTKLATELPQRLSLIRSGIDGDIDNAIADCDILLDDLRDTEAALRP